MSTLDRTSAMKALRARRWLSAGASLAALASFTAASAAPAALDINLAAQPLRQAIATIETRGGSNVAYDPADLADYQSEPVHHAHTVKDALLQATAGSGLSVETAPDGSLRLVRRPGSGQTVQEVVVRAHLSEAEQNLNVNSANSSNRTGLSLQDLPRSTAVVTSKLIQDEQVQTVQDALRNVSGIGATTSVQGTPSFSIRGFQASALVNGLTAGAGANQPVANVESVEVLKGPDAVLSGSDNLGGVVNIVTKRPTSDPLFDLTAETGSFGERKGILDVSGPLTADHKISARFIAEDAAVDVNYQGYHGRSEYLLAPSIRYKDNSSDYVLGFSSSDQYTPINSYTAVNQNTPDAALYPQYRHPFGTPDQGINNRNARVYYDANQKITSWLTFVSRGEYDFTTQNFLTYEPIAALNKASNSYLLFALANQIKTPSEAFDSYLRAKFDVFGVGNTVIVGYNYSHYNSETYNPSTPLQGYLVQLPTGAGSNYFTRTPYAGPASFPEISHADTPSYFQPETQHGIYAQDVLTYGPMHIIGGMRYNIYQSGVSYVAANYAQYDSTKTYHAVTPDIGGVFDVTKYMSVYANYLKGFTPGGINSYPNSVVPGAYTGVTFPNITTENIEGGVKFNFFRKRLSFVGSVYQLKQSNLVDTSTPGATFLIPGERSRGVELDLDGRILPGWNVAASLTGADFEYLKPTIYYNRVTGQSDLRYSVFSSYDIQGGVLKGLGGALGVYGASRSYISAGQAPSYTYQGAGVYAAVPSRVELDANLYYTINHVRLNAGVKNVLNRTNYLSAPTINYVPLQQPRVFVLTATYSFF